MSEGSSLRGECYDSWRRPQNQKDYGEEPLPAAGERFRCRREREPEGPAEAAQGQGGHVTAPQSHASPIIL